MKSIEFFIAFRFLKEGRSQTLLIFAGAAAGVATIVFLASLIVGLQQNIIDQVLGNQPDVFVEAPEREDPQSIYEDSEGEVVFRRVESRPQRVQDIDDWQGLMEDFAADPDVVAVSAMASGSAVVLSGPIVYPIQIRGVDPERYQQIVDVEGGLEAGAFEVDDNGAVIGTVLAEELDVEVGDRIRIRDVQEQVRTFVVNGIFDLGADPINETWVFVEIRDGQTLLGLGDNINRIEANVTDVFAADEVSRRLQGLTDEDVTSWREANEDLLRALRTQSASTILIGVFVAIAVALGIASVLVVTVVQKRGQVGVLRAMGTPTGTILRVFLIQGAIVGLVGSIVGSVGGTILALGFNQFVRDAEGEVVFPIEPSPTIFVAACILATLTGLLAAIAPARRAARLDPADAIHDA